MEASFAKLNFPDPQPTSFQKKMLREVFCTQKALFYSHFLTVSTGAD